MKPREVLLGYGSLLSKRGIAREGTVPTVHAAWAVRLAGQRGLGKSFADRGRFVMDAYLDSLDATTIRALPAFLDASAAHAPTHLRIPSQEPALDAASRDVGHTFEAMALEVDGEDWLWFAAREAFVPGLASTLAHDAAIAGVNVATLLGRLRGTLGVAQYLDLLFSRYVVGLPQVGRAAFDAAYAPCPVRLSPVGGDSASGAPEWGICCASPAKPLPPLKAHEAAGQPGCDERGLLRYYHDALLGTAHGLDLSDLVDPAFEAAHPELTEWRAVDLAHELMPLAAFVGNIPKGLLPAPDARQTGGMKPVSNLISLADALAMVNSAAEPKVRAETVPLAEANRRILGAALRSRFANPDVPKAAMDGYAVQARDTHGAGVTTPCPLRLVGVVHGGAPPETMKTVLPGTCVQIATGAALPPGADCVVMVEATRRADEIVSVYRPHRPGQNVLPVGSDWDDEAIVCEAGMRLGPAQLAAAAAIGAETVSVFARPRVAILSTGDEVVPLGTTRAKGAVFDSNAWALAALVEAAGGLTTRLPPVPDEEEALRLALDAAARDYDVVVLTGGTSAGARDLLPALVAAHGEVLFHGVKIRPGKPVLFGRWAKTPLFGLPGYPTSCVVTAELLLVPLLRKMVGDLGSPLTASGILGHDVTSAAGWSQVVPVRRDDDGRWVSVLRGSAAVTSLSAAEGYMLVAEGATLVSAGSPVDVRFWTR